MTSDGVRLDFKRSPLPPPSLLHGKPRSLKEAQALYDHVRTVALFLDAVNQLGARGNSSLPVDVGVGPIIATLLPFVGEFFDLIAGLYLVLLSLLLGVSWILAARMCINLAIDSTVSLIPLIGPFLDVAFKANLMNLQLLEDSLRQSKWAAITLPPPRSWNPFSRVQRAQTVRAL